MTLSYSLGLYAPRSRSAFCQRKSAISRKLAKLRGPEAAIVGGVVVMAGRAGARVGTGAEAGAAAWPSGLPGAGRRRSMMPALSRPASSRSSARHSSFSRSRGSCANAACRPTYSDANNASSGAAFDRRSARARPRRSARATSSSRVSCSRAGRAVPSARGRVVMERRAGRVAPCAGGAEPGNRAGCRPADDVRPSGASNFGWS